MKVLPQAIREHIKQETTTLCRCWILETTSNDKLGFTDHDEDIFVEGVKCEKDAGVEQSGVEERLGLNADTSEISGALQSDFITPADIETGKYDNARISTYIVNWQKHDEYFLDDVSLVGEIIREDGHYKMELRGLASELDQTKGNHFIKNCQADLGDSRCKLSLSKPEYTGSGQVINLRSNLVYWVSGLDGFDNGWFRGGHLTWRSGDNKGRKIEVTEHIKSNGVTLIHLWQPMPFAVQVNDNFSIQVGCDKSLSTCSRKFSNTLNFRGFPHMPGNAFALSYAGNEDNFDGGPIIE